MLGIAPFAAAPFASLANDDKTAEITGVAATGAVGSVTLSSAVALTGVEATGEIGDVSYSQEISGVESTGEVGDVAFGGSEIELSGVQSTGNVTQTFPELEIALTGAEATGEVGNVVATQVLDGVVATGEVGSVAIGDREIEISGVESTGEVGSIAGTSRTVLLSGVFSTTAVGTVVYTRSEAITGVQATGAVGTVEFSYTLDGNVAYGQVGQLGVIHTVALIEGWGAYGWGVEPWGGTAGANQINTAVGDVVGGQLLGPGVSATGGVGTVTPVVMPYPEGDVAYGFVGTVGNVHEVALNTDDVLGWGEGPWSGDTSTSGFYDIAWGGQSTNNPSVGHGQVGTVVAGPAIPLTGVQATGQVGTVSPSHTLDPLSGVEAVGEVGTVYPVFYVALTGVQATGYVGTMGVIHINALTGVEAIGRVGDVCVGNWTIIDTTQNASWQVIQSAQASSWQAIQNNQDAEWDLVVTEKC